MKSFISHIIQTIGLGNLLSYVWDIVLEELQKLAVESTAKWDDKAVEILDKIMKEVIEELS